MPQASRSLSGTLDTTQMPRTDVVLSRLGKGAFRVFSFWNLCGHLSDSNCRLRSHRVGLALSVMSRKGVHTRWRLYGAIIALMAGSALASIGDRLPDFRECIQVCRQETCLVSSHIADADYLLGMQTSKLRRRLGHYT